MWVFSTGIPVDCQEDFCRVFEESGFVEEVINFYINKERRLLTENTSGTDWRHSERHNTGEWEQLVRTHLPNWLFWLTYILTAQARLVDENRPMSRVQLARLLKLDCFTVESIT